ncbi:hypothetical protein P171DRAFT_437302 [Karstenula rhodostoma CBS 690.94]|uniref:Uncharacterized protein n=1 Tax=Karstenula rhodostoma CBS 690.94 TaxID=1392251 RepID=A0A9P4P6A0_9PLEO|nr:hypothetical protein P171DRAFT_437302 [Karstenula rhodostoma CBS 690.94]
MSRKDGSAVAWSAPLITGRSHGSVLHDTPNMPDSHMQAHLTINLQPTIRNQASAQGCRARQRFVDNCLTRSSADPV